MISEPSSHAASKCKNLTTEWDSIPKGLCLIRMMHERAGRHCLHIKLKVDDSPWYDQPCVPFYSQEATKGSHAQFWDWASENLPIWDYPAPVKAE